MTGGFASGNARMVQLWLRGDSILFHADSIGKMARIYLDSARFHIDSLLNDTLVFNRFRDLERFWADTVGHGRFFDFRVFRDSLPEGWRFNPDELRSFERAEFPGFEMMIGRSAVAGAEFTELNEGLAQYFGTNRGLLVLRVGPETPAARAGLEAGDVLTRVNSRAVGEVEDFRMAVARASSSTVKLDIIRKGKPRTLDLQVRRRVTRDE